ncbi:MAG: DUF5362 family protein [bacterium]
MESSVTTPAVNQTVQQNVRGMKGWLKFLGIFQIVAGILQALTIVGIIYAWLPIWMGIILNSAGNKAHEYAERGEPQALAGLTGKLKVYFIITGIVTIFVLVVGTLALIIGIILSLLGIISLPSIIDSLNS